VEVYFRGEIMRKLSTTTKKTPEQDWDDSDWAVANAQALSERYPDQWVAIYNKAVIAHHKELGRAAAKVKRQGIANPVFKFVERGFHVYRYSITL
jgi:hypothetical protein